MEPWTAGSPNDQSVIDGRLLLHFRPDLPKELMHRIFLYLTLRDCANTALVCRFWRVCYHNVYFNYSFLREFDSDRFNEKEMQTVFKKAGSKMRHIKKM
jgi:F-box-like